MFAHDHACTHTTPVKQTNTNRLNLPFISLQDNKFYRENDNKIKHKLDYHGLKEMERKVAHSEKDYFSINDIYNSKLINPRSRVTRDNKIEEFLLWLTDRRIRGLIRFICSNYPRIEKVQAKQTIGKIF